MDEKRGWSKVRTLNQLQDLSGRVALITGGAGYIGQASAETLLELGATVGLIDLDPTKCEEAVASLSKSGMPGRAFAASADLSDEAAARFIVEKVIEEHGRLDILVHCAGFVGTTKFPGWAVPFEEQSLEAWDAALRINLSSAFYLTQASQKALGASGRGAVVFLGSIYGVAGPDMRLYETTQMANPAAYGASKGGLLQLTRYLACLLAPSVRVNMISPGGVWRNQPESFHKRYISRTPMGRMANEEDLKGAVAFFVSDLSAYVTGQNLLIDGGWTAW